MAVQHMLRRTCGTALGKYDVCTCVTIVHVRVCEYACVLGVWCRVCARRERKIDNNAVQIILIIAENISLEVQVDI